MPRLLISFAILAIAAPSIAAHAQSGQTSSPEIVVEGKRPDESKRVCRSEVSTGSIMATKTCRTNGEWEAIRQRSIAAMEHVQEFLETQRHVRTMSGN